jgi:hypothetical protein
MQCQSQCLRLRVFICLRFVQGTCNSLNHVNFGTPGQLNFENLTNFACGDRSAEEPGRPGGVIPKRGANARRECITSETAPAGSRTGP